MYDYVESLFKGVDILIDKRLEDVSYDSTIICTVVDNSDKKNGKYRVSDGSVTYIAYSDQDSYRTGEQVRVSVPMGDFSQKKFITGKYVSDNDTLPITYISPVDTFVNVSGNLVQLTSDTIGIVANGPNEKRIIWNQKLDMQEFGELQKNNIYNTIILKAEFKTLFNNYSLVSGTYGLRIELLVRPSINSDFQMKRTIELDSKEMFGNPYNFTIYSIQSKSFNISSIGIIEGIELSLFQNNDFKDSKKGFLEYPKGVEVPDNIIVKNIELGFGTDVSAIEDNVVQIYSDNILSYKYLEHSNDTNLKQMGLMWYNKDEDNKYIGFSDGIYNPEYDEFNYLKTSKVSQRLIAQKGRENIAPDKKSLTLAANIEEAVPSIRKALDVVTKDLVNTLRDFKQAVSSVQRYVDNIDSLLSLRSGVDENEQRYLIIYTDKINSLLDNSTEGAEGLVQIYRDVLEYRYKKWLKKNNIDGVVESAWQARWNVDVGREIYAEFIKIVSELSWLLDKTSNGGFSGIDSTYSGYKSRYDVYEVRILRDLHKMWGYLGMLVLRSETEGTSYAFGKKVEQVEYDAYQKYFPSGVIGLNQTKDNKTIVGYTNGAGEWVPGFENNTSFTVYKEPDLSDYDNQYCIYWYHYEKDYQAPDSEAILSPGWRRLTPNELQAQPHSIVGDSDGVNVGLSSVYYYDDDADCNFDYHKTTVYKEGRIYYTKTDDGEYEKATPTQQQVQNKANDYYARCRVNEENKFIHAPRTLSGKGLIRRYMYEKAEQEKYKAVVFYNHEMFVSNELVFTNEDIIPDEATLDSGDVLIFEHLTNSMDDYQLYTITNYLFDGADATKIRQIRCRYDGLLAKDNAFINGYIYWYIPIGDITMIDIDMEDLIDNKGFSFDDTRSSFDFREIVFKDHSGKQYEKNVYYQKLSASQVEAEKKNNKNYYIIDNNGESYSLLTVDTQPPGTIYEKVYTEYCLYKQILAQPKKEEDIPDNAYEWDKWDYTNGSDKKIDNRDFWYKIKPLYQNAAKNSIKCIFVPNPDENISITGEKLFTFGVKGTSGTKYTLAITPTTDHKSASGKWGLDLRARLKDFNDQDLEITLLENSLLSVEWVGCTVTDAGDKTTIQGPDQNLIGLKTEFNFNTPIGYYGLIQASGKISLEGESIAGLANLTEEEASKKQRQRDVDLIVIHSIPFCGHCSDGTIYHEDDFILSGPTQIIYNNLGTLDDKSMFNTPYTLYAKRDCEVLGKKYKKDQIIKDVKWKIIYRKVVDRTTKEFEELNSSELKFYNSYMPKFENDSNCLSVPPLYLSGLDRYAIVVAYMKKDGKDFYLWRQPLIIIQNKYASPLLNDWDGSFKINEEAGTILGTMFGAGRKNTNNTFDGVLMGDIAKGTSSNIGFEDRSDLGNCGQTGLGIYGFNDGAQSFGLNVDGTAFFGKAGKGRILIDGNSGSISSASYNTTNSSAGMMIDLDDGFISMKSASISDSSNRYTDCGKTEVKISVEKPYFQINVPNPQNVNEKKSLIYISDGSDINNGYYLQTADYNGSNAGVKIDLQGGIIDAYNFKIRAGTTNKILINSNPSDRGPSIDGDDAYYFYAGKSDGSEYIQYLGNGSVGISSRSFILKVIGNSSSTTDNSLIMDSTGTSGYYFYMGKSNGSEYLQYTNDGAVGIKTNMFNLVAGTSPNQIKINSAAEIYPLQIGSNFKVKWDGSIEASAGKIGGWNITSSYIDSYTGDSRGDKTRFYLASDKDSADYYIYAQGSIKNDKNEIIGYERKFSVSKDGRLFAKNADISGTITASYLTANVGGSIGGWTISSTGLSKDSTSIKSDGTINGAAISGGSISITKGSYYFNMGTETNHPNCSGLNVNDAINFGSDKGIFINGLNGAISGATDNTVTIDGAVYFRNGAVNIGGGNLSVDNDLVVDQKITAASLTITGTEKSISSGGYTGYSGYVRVLQNPPSDFIWLYFKNGIYITAAEHDPG